MKSKAKMSLILVFLLIFNFFHSVPADYNELQVKNSRFYCNLEIGTESKLNTKRRRIQKHKTKQQPKKKKYIHIQKDYEIVVFIEIDNIVSVLLYCDSYRKWFLCLQ